VNIFVGNLAFTTTEQDLRQFFEPYGSVETIRIMTDRATGRPRGFGFVEMPDSRAAQTAIDALNGTSLAGRALTVNEARPKPEGGFGGGGGYGGNRGGGGGGGGRREPRW
jgi:RNA recognition motif-containing protein